MNINQTLRAALAPIAPTEADAYEGKKGVYITFNYNTIPANYGDDEPEHERISAQVHLYAPLGVDTLEKRRAVKKALVSAGFTWPAYTNASGKDGQHHVFECETVQEAGGGVVGRLTVNGLDALSDDLAALARLPDKVVEEILDAGAEVITAAQREEIEKQWKGPYSLGMSAKAVKKGRVTKGKDGRSITIYPRGTRTRGGRITRNAEIAFINEYGAPGRHIAARPAIDTANKKKEAEAVEAGEKVYRDYLDSKNL